MTDPRDEERAREWLMATCSTGEPTKVRLNSLAALLSEACREEREACEGIVRDRLEGVYIVSKSGTHLAGEVDDILRRFRERAQPEVTK